MAKQEMMPKHIHTAFLEKGKFFPRLRECPKCRQLAKKAQRIRERAGELNGRR